MQTKSHLQGLTLSQRLAVGSCVALIVVSMLWLVSWAQKPAMVPLLDQPMRTDDLAAIRSHLDTVGATYQVSGDRILVASADRHRLKGLLGENQLLPSDVSIGYSKIIEEGNAFLSADQQSRRWTLALSNELARTLNNFTWINRARVFVNDAQQRRVGAPSIRPTASINLVLKPGQELDEGRVRAVAALVSGAVAGMDIADVNIVDAQGRSYQVRKDIGMSGLGDLEARQKKEQYFRDNVLALLDFIPGVRVRVHADLDPEMRVESITKYGDPVMVEKESEGELQERGTSSGEPGVVPNTTVGVASAGGAEKTERERSHNVFKGEVDVTQTKVESARYGIKGLTASILVPRSYLSAIFRKANEDKDPSDEELEAARSTQKVLDDIRRKVANALGGKPGEVDLVEVSWFYDQAMMSFDEAMVAGMDEGMMKFVRAYGTKAGLGALAVMSLLMMLMMVRKVGEGPVLPGEESPQGKIIKIRGKKGAEVEELDFSAGEPVGEALETEPLMMAREVDEATLQTQRVVEQIMEMVKEDPQVAGQILRKWMDEE
ncbi:MAG: hypothetical protein GXY44_06595 [Phycisphaerales bacterium]|nr:hypothetical protein [Phycisphaerales bacterium]